MAQAFAAGRPWEVSLQLHMDLLGERAEAVRVGRLLHGLAPHCLVKVPFSPEHPETLLAARDLERAGVPVNVTSTFSPRQVIAAALLANATRTNVFLGRIEQGLEAELLGEHVALEAQRALAEVRQRDGVDTQLIVASMRDWRTFVRLAGCDVFTAPCSVLSGFLAQEEVGPREVIDRREEVYVFRISKPVQVTLGEERIRRLWKVEPEFVEFLRELRRRPDFLALTDGDALFARFDAAGFGDFFHAPTEAERREASAGKLPALDRELVRTAALDAHYSLLANADFAAHQVKIDDELRERV